MASRAKDDELNELDTSFRVGIIAGEASGDLLGSELIGAIREQYPYATFEGVGGQHMIECGFRSYYDIERLSVMGIVEPLKRLPELLSMRFRLIRHFKNNPPDIFIGIDSPDFNLGIEKQLKKSGIPTIHYVSPTVWAWRKGRIHGIKKSIDKMLVLFPFEKGIYEDNQIEVSFVGHPLADRVNAEDCVSAREKLKLKPSGTWVAILPGSREGEINRLLPTFLETARWLLAKDAALKFMIPAANMDRLIQIEKMVETYDDLKDFKVQVFLNQASTVISASDVVLVTSGTATLETMLLKRPMVVAYKLGHWTYQLAKVLVKIPRIAIPNILFKGDLVPEFIQEAATPENLGAALLKFLQNKPYAQDTLSSFNELNNMLKCESKHKAAQAVIDLVSGKTYEQSGREYDKSQDTSK